MSSFFNKFKNRLQAVRFEFVVSVHMLQPWPAGSKAIAIGWQRGKRRRGATSAIYPHANPGKLDCNLKFNEKFTVPVTLYKSTGGTSSSSLGPFKKKCLILAVLETDGRTNNTSALGRVVIDLAEFASIDGSELRTVKVACNKSIHAAVGDPQLTVTVKCRWKKSGAQMTDDELASMSTDTTATGSTLGGGGFGKLLIKPKRSSAAAPSGKEGEDMAAFDRMATVEEEEEEDDVGETLESRSDRDLADFEGLSDFDSGSPDLAGVWPVGSPKHARGPTPQSSPPAGPRRPGGAHDSATSHNRTYSGASAPASVAHSTISTVGPASTYSSATAGSFPQPAARVSGGGGGASPFQQSVPPLPMRQLSRTRSDDFVVPDAAAMTMMMHGSDEDEDGPLSPTLQTARSFGQPPSVPAAPQSVASSTRAAPPPPEVDEAPARYRSKWRSTPLVAETPRIVSMPEPPLGDPLGAGMEAYQDELLIAASTEVCVYLSRMALGPLQSNARITHAYARRLSRTLVCLGRNDGLRFGRMIMALTERLIGEAFVRAATSQEYAPVGYWWSNVVHLRGFMQSLNLVSQAGGVAAGHWAATAFLPELLQLEQRIFQELAEHLWERVLLPALLTSNGSLSRSNSSSGGAPASSSRRQQQEAALRRWLAALDAANAHIVLLGTDGHAQVLQAHLLLDCLRRADKLLFYSLVTPAEPRGSASGAQDAYSSSGRVSLDQSALPFQRGVTGFGAGMTLKQVVTRLQQWAFGEGNLREAWAKLPERAQSLFPLLRGTADLLMMPKDLLADKSIRGEVCSSLSVSSIVRVLELFQPDEYSPQGISARLLDGLRVEAEGAAGSSGGSGSDGAVAGDMRVPGPYFPPTDEVIMAEVEAGVEPGLEYDGDSEDELDALSLAHSGGGDAAPVRFRLLHNLWASGVPRSKRMTIDRLPEEEEEEEDEGQGMR